MMTRLALLLLSLLLGCSAPAVSAAETGAYVWNNVAIYGGGFVSGIITHPSEKDLIYARTDIGGAYRWDAANKRWIALTDWTTGDTWNYTGIESLAVDPSDPNRVYVAAGTYTNNWSGMGAILRSDDRGESWHKTDLPFKNGGNEDGRNGGERLQVDPHDGQVIFFGTRNQGLRKSGDRGINWALVESFPIKQRTNGVGLIFVGFDPSSGKPGAPTPTVYVGVSGAQPSIYRSTDAGASWHPVPDQPTGLLPNHGVVAPDGALYVTYGNAPGPNGMTDGAVYRLDTRSGAWTNISPIKPSQDDKFGYGGITFDARHPQTLVVSTMDRWARKDNLFRSTDGGKTWTSLLDKALFDHTTAPYTRNATPHWIGDVEINPLDPDHVLFVTGYGIWACRNLTAADKGQGTHWTFDNIGLEECVINDLISPPAGEALVLSAMWDLDGFRHVALDRSPPDGHFRPSFGRCTSLDFAEQKPEFIARVYGGNNTHGSYSTDNGVTWTAFPSAPPGHGDGMIAVSADGATLAWAPRESPIYYSSDRGATWTESTGAPTGAKLVSDRHDPRAFYALDAGEGAVYVSTDAGKTFTPAARGLPGGAGAIRAVPGAAGNVWLATPGGVYRSVDSARTFARVGAFEVAYQLGFGKAAPGQQHPAVYVVAKLDGVYGFYRSDTAGQSWVRINDDKHQFAHINAISGDPRVYGRVYLGSASRGVIYGQPSNRE